MHTYDDLFPACQCFFTVESGHARITIGYRMIDVSSLGNNEPHSTLCSTAIVVRHIVAGYAMRRFIARHGRHYKTVAQFCTTKFERLKEIFLQQFHWSQFNSPVGTMR
ncbi:hypothetical protein A3194_12770 [Candidatus Thiodiazotropha endoloripes]|nr:hypothetical protein A3194_12770 [Candidatus Thiodiazotropha endoloripes]